MKKFIFVAALAMAGMSAFAQAPQIRVFSHRGGRMENDENTMQAFVASDKGGYSGYETDIRMTKDGKLIVTHDSKLDRTTNGSGAVELKTLAEIQKLDTKKGNKMLTLDELMNFLKDKKGLYVEFEMKTAPVNLYPTARLEEYVDKLYSTVMAKKPADADFLFTSSDVRALRTMRQRHPDAEMLLIVNEPLNKETIAFAESLDMKRIGAKMGGTTRDAVKLAHDKGLIVSLWPGQSIADFMLGVYLGADFLCTDRPAEYMEWQKKNAPYLNVRY